MNNSGSMWSVLFRSLAGVMAGARQDVLQQILQSLTPSGGGEQVPTATVVRVFNLLSVTLGDPDLGLHAGERAPIGTFEVIDYAVRASETLEDALVRVCRYYALINNAGYLGLHKAAAQTDLVHRSDADRNDRRQAVEFLYASIVSRSRQLVKDWKLTAVRFAHDHPTDTREHERIFAAPVSFGQDDDAVAFRTADLRAPIENSQPALAAVMDHYVDNLFAHLKPDYLGQVRYAIGEAIRGRDPSLAVTAHQLKISARTLQRKLAALNTSHSDLVDEVRKALSVRYVKTLSLSFGEVGFLLGYSEAASFYRAFRRWHNMTPSEYRAQNI